MTTTPKLHSILSEFNSHPRDSNIKFYEKDHKYVILSEPGVKYTSVTTWNHEHFPKFNADEIIDNMMKSKGWKEGHKYWGLTPEQIKSQWNTNRDNVAGAGTDMHYEIECFHNNPYLSKGYTNKELYDLYTINNTTTKSSVLCVGSFVEVNYKGRGKWYTGEIVGKDNNNFYDVCYEDGDYESGIPEDMIRSLEKVSVTTIKPIEWQYFMNFVKDHPHLKPYRTEWTVWHEDVKISGSIDMIYENPDGTLSIYDWKRAKNITRINQFNKFALPPQICHLPDSNFWHYALQLNTYKAILEQKYGKVIKDLFLVRLHPDAEEKNYELIQLPDLSVEIRDLFEERKRQLSK